AETGMLERFEHGYPEVSGIEHVGIQKQKDGKNFICVPVIGGVLSGEKLREIANIADEFEGEIRLTPYQNFILPHVPNGELDTVLKWLKEIGLPVEGARMRWDIVGCPSNFCGKSVDPHPKEVAKRIVEHLENCFGEKLTNLKLLVHLSGCLHDCGLHRVAHIGLLGVKAVGDDGVRELYNLSLGGDLGAKSSLSQPVKNMLTPEQAVTAVEKLVRACLKEGFDDFGEFCRAHKLEELKSIASK
ncbi:MAG: hypothetical protein ACK4GQ_03365, partial [Candidatus Hadarchaeales archaeon]